ncbi:Transmembrane 9 superfamily member 2 [Labeo rohita]|uniref:Transmembrane 9 superfamily member n=1 Tax=Labeo rohita TaxID=84645 RepID=A0ABQ8N047_LABRO|nr:Transmembrane 9 superfamily member 2 [Labeo rohita]
MVVFHRVRVVFLLLFVCGSLRDALSFYLPGLAPVSFCEKEESEKNSDVPDCKSMIELFVNRLDSVESVLPYEYTAFDFCADQAEKRPSENLGQFSFKKNLECQSVCVKPYNTEKAEDKAKLDFLKKGMLLNYQHHWIVDNMPVTWCYDVEDNQKFCNPGFPIGCYVTDTGRAKDACVVNADFNDKDTFYIFNHVDITIFYHVVENEAAGARLVAAKLEPKSYKHTNLEKPDCTGPPMSLNNNIMNSLVIVLFLSGMVAMIMLRTLHKDIARYNQMDSVEDAQEEFGWKLVHGDVFRPPRKGMLLSVFLGSGTQIFIMTFCLFGFPVTCQPWGSDDVCSGAVGAPGYSSWLCGCPLLQMVVFADFFVMNLILWGEGSSAAMPFGTLVAILALWFCISVPLTFIGAYFGFKKSGIEHPVRTNQIPRQIPEQSFYTKPLPGIVMGGILPFGCIFIQLFFILNSIWSHQMYYMFGFLFLVFIILVITCSEATILLCYFHLCAEDYHWQWRSFLTSGFTAVYFLVYAIHYFFSKLQISTIGFFACFWFVTKIYSVVKVD